MLLQTHFHYEVSPHILLDLCIAGCLFCIFVLYMGFFNVTVNASLIVTDKRNKISLKITMLNLEAALVSFIGGNYSLGIFNIITSKKQPLDIPNTLFTTFRFTNKPQVKQWKCT